MTEQEQLLQSLLNIQNSQSKKELEYRLYYNEYGAPLTYTTDSLDGDYIVITKEQYAQASHNIRVRDGQLIDARNLRLIQKLEKSSNGFATSKYDINIITDINCNYWALKTYEYHR